MKQRFLNQKLGKRASRKAEIQKAKLFATQVTQARRATVPGRNLPAGKPT